MTDNITWTNSTRKLSDLIPWEINPAQIGKDEAKRLEESLTEFGQIQTIAISPTNEIYDGHQRQAVWGASRKFGKDYEVDVRVSSRELTEQERKKLVIYLRKSTVGEFDFDILANNWDFDELIDWGFKSWELGDVIGGPDTNDMSENRGNNTIRPSDNFADVPLQCGEITTLLKRDLYDAIVKHTSGSSFDIIDSVVRRGIDALNWID